jgi:hypothetical protein
MRLESKIIITTITVIALAITLATMTVAQIVVAQSDNSLEKNCKNGNSLACERLNGNPAEPNERAGTINNCIPIPNEPCLSFGGVHSPR